MITDPSTAFRILPSPDSLLGVEVTRRGLWRSKRRELFCFERYEGSLLYMPGQPQVCKLSVSAERDSIVCRDAHASANENRKRADAARRILSENWPERLEFHSQTFKPKILRGYVVSGIVGSGRFEKSAAANLVISTVKDGLLQIDGDAAVKLSDLGIKTPKPMLGFVRTEDEALVRILLWANSPSSFNPA